MNINRNELCDTFDNVALDAKGDYVYSIALDRLYDMDACQKALTDLEVDYGRVGDGGRVKDVTIVISRSKFEELWDKYDMSWILSDMFSEVHGVVDVYMGLEDLIMRGGTEIVGWKHGYRNFYFARAVHEILWPGVDVPKLLMDHTPFYEYAKI